jgi:TonB family protein
MPASHRAIIPGWTWLTSLALHGALIGGFGWLAFRTLQPAASSSSPREVAPVSDVTIAVELPAFAEGTLAADEAPDPAGAPPSHAGGSPIARVDTGRSGRGGDPTVEHRAVHLSDVDERMRLSSSMPSHLDRDQVQRLRSSTERASREDRRSTTHPTELTFLSTGGGDRAERRPSSPRDPSRGVLLVSTAPAAAGGKLGLLDRPSFEDGPRHDVGGARIGMAAPSPGLGVSDATAGPDHRSSAAVRLSRPDVTTASVQVEAIRRGRPNDDVDSEQAVATTVQALVHASTSGGSPGIGVGGSGGGGAPGAGGATGAGSHPPPLGTGDGDWLDLDTSDPRLVPYFRRVHAKVDPLWVNAFPKSAMLELKQGTVILEFTIAADGTAKVSWPPARPSGIDEFDRNCADALRRASPFDPIPRELGVQVLHVRAPFVAVNPIVR